MGAVFLVVGFDEPEASVCVGCAFGCTSVSIGSF